MNERIKELIKQHGINITIDGLGYGEGNVEGLAELIVGECIDVFSKDLPEDSGKMLEVVNRVCDVAEHFGVKNEK